MANKTHAQKVIENRICNKAHVHILAFQDTNAYSDYSDYFDEAIYSESYSWEEEYSLK